MTEQPPHPETGCVAAATRDGHQRSPGGHMNPPPIEPEAGDAPRTADLPTFTPKPRTRFARFYPDGSMGVEPADVDLEQARKQLCDSSDDDDVEILEVEVTVVRRHGKPKLQAVRDIECKCPTCGERFTVDLPAAEATP